MCVDSLVPVSCASIICHVLPTGPNQHPCELVRSYSTTLPHGGHFKTIATQTNQSQSCLVSKYESCYVKLPGK